MVSFVKIVILCIAIAVDSTPIERQVIRTKPCTRRTTYGARYRYGNFRVNTKLSGHRRTVPCIKRKRHWISRWKQGTTNCPEIYTSWRQFGSMTVPLRLIFSRRCFNTKCSWHKTFLSLHNFIRTAHFSLCLFLYWLRTAFFNS